MSDKTLRMSTWPGRLSLPHMFCYSHALCPLTLGHLLCRPCIKCKEDHITGLFDPTFAGAKGKPEMIQACIYYFPSATIMLFLYVVF